MMTGATAAALHFKWWSVFVIWTLCGLLGLVGLVGLAFAIHGIWQHWELVLDIPLRKGSCFWKTPLKSTVRQFSFDDIKSINVSSEGDNANPLLWFVDITFGDNPSLGLGTVDKKERAVEYAALLADILGTSVTERNLSNITQLKSD